MVLHPAPAPRTSHCEPLTGSRTEDLDRRLRRDALEGLSGVPKSIPSKWFYDEAGSKLFDDITRLPEYYLTRCEREILEDRAADIVRESGAVVLVELGCGLSEKTRLLLDSFDNFGNLVRFIPFDVDGGVLDMASQQLMRRYPRFRVKPVVGDFEKDLEALRTPERALVIFLGSTIGNLNRLQRGRLLDGLKESLKPGDTFLLGVDLVKDVAILEAAYNDSAGVSAAFNLNMLSVLNRRLGANFDLNGFEHVARFNAEAEQMEMFLRAVRPQAVRLDAIDLTVRFAPNELLHTEISVKFRRSGIEAELAAAGLQPVRWWTDAGQNFALSLSVRR